MSVETYCPSFGVDIRSIVVHNIPIERDTEHSTNRSPGDAPMTTTNTSTFTMNNKTYRCSETTASVMRDVVKSYRDGGSKDASAIAAMMSLGLKTGRIEEI